MKVAIMQPYLLPYIGYFQLISAVDLFIVYDNIKYTKKGWINRNRMLRNGADVMFSLPLKGASDHLDVVDREVAPEFHGKKILQQFEGAYHRAPFWAETWPLIEDVMLNAERNLFRFLHHSIMGTCRHLAIATEIRISSSIAIDHALSGQDKVLALCEAVGATTYVNSPGGVSLYSSDAFSTRGMALRFLYPEPLVYPQFSGEFVPWLSIVDVLMFNGADATQHSVTANYRIS